MKEYKIILNSRVEKKLFDIFEYILLNQSRKEAELLLLNIEQSIFSLKTFPRRFAKINENLSFSNYEVRNIFSNSFRIIYVILCDSVRILDIRHSAMEPLSKNDIKDFYEKT